MCSPCLVNNKLIIIITGLGITVFWSTEIKWNLKLTKNLAISAPR